MHNQAYGLGHNVERNLGEILQPGREVSALQPPSSSLAWLALTLAEKGHTPIITVFDGPRNQDQFLQDLDTLSGDCMNSFGCFPAWESLPQDGQRPQPEIAGERMSLLLACRENRCPDILVTSIQAVMQKTISLSNLDRAAMSLDVGEDIPLEELTKQLMQRGYHFVPQVTASTEAATRGGIVDVWPPTELFPARIELFGTQVGFHPIF